MNAETGPTADQLAAGIKSGFNLLLARLADPFPAELVHWKPQAVKGNRALAIAYITARDVMDRLDQIVGVDGWQDRYRIEGTNVVCGLSIRAGKRWITKYDVAGPSDQPDEGDQMKAAFSDAMKRAAVKFGIGRYLYRLPQTWCDFDPAKRQIVQPPRLPDWALPRQKPNSQPERKALPGPAIPPARTIVNGTPCLDSKEAAEIVLLLDQAKLTTADFCTVYGVTDVFYLPQAKYAEAVERIRKKISAAA